MWTAEALWTRRAQTRTSHRPPAGLERPGLSRRGSGTRGGSPASSSLRSRSCSPSRRRHRAAYQGVPGGLGALLSVTTAIVCGPIAGALVSLVGGLIFVPLVADHEPGAQFAIFLWLIAAVGSGVISGRLRRSDVDRTEAMARERLAANRLHRLQGITEVLARAMTPEEVAQGTITAAISALGADAAGLTVRTDDDPDTLRVLAASTSDEGLFSGWRRSRDRYPLRGTGDRADRPADLHRDSSRAARALPDREEDRGRRAVRRIRGCPRGSRNRGPRRAHPGLPPRSHGAPGGTRPPAVDGASSGDRASTASVRAKTSVARGRRPNTRKIGCGSSRP